MRKMLALIVLTLSAFNVPAFADTSTAAPADATAVAKDDAAIAKAQTDIERDRAQKAQDKANGNWAGQAVDSMALGYDHVFHTEKSGEKSTDTVIMNHDTQQ